MKKIETIIKAVLLSTFLLTGAVAFAGEDIDTSTWGDIQEVEAERYEQIEGKWEIEVEFEDKDDIVFYVYDIEDEDQLVDEIRKVLVTEYNQDLNSIDVRAILDVDQDEWEREDDDDEDEDDDDKEEYDEDEDQDEKDKSKNDENDKDDERIETISSEEFDNLFRLLVMLLIQSLLQNGDIDTDKLGDLLELVG